MEMDKPITIVNIMVRDKTIAYNFFLNLFLNLNLYKFSNVVSKDTKPLDNKFIEIIFIMMLEVLFKFNEVNIVSIFDM